MAYTQEMLEELKENYASGILSVSHGDKKISYASMEEMWRAIQRIEQSLASPSKKAPISTRAGYRRY